MDFDWLWGGPAIYVISVFGSVYGRYRLKFPDSFPFGEGVMVVVLLLASMLVPIVWLVWIVLALRAKTLARSAFSLCFPVTGILILAYGGRLGDGIRVWVDHDFHGQVVADARAGRCERRWDDAPHAERYWIMKCGPSPVVEFVWDAYFGQWNGVVCDAEDQITLVDVAHDAGWKHGSVYDFGCIGPPVSLGGHFYRVSGRAC